MIRFDLQALRKDVETWVQIPARPLEVTMTLEEALKQVMDSPEHSRHYVFASRPWTLDSEAFIEDRGGLGWSEDYEGTLPMGIECLGYVKDIRKHYLRYSQAHDDEQYALEKLLEFYEYGWRYRLRYRRQFDD